MLEIQLHHGFDCSVERFWALFFDADWTRELILGGLGFATCDIDPMAERGDLRTRSMRVTPKLDLPGPVAKFLGPKLGYTENGRYNTKTQEWSYDLILSVFSDRIRMGGTVTVAANGADRCTRNSKLWCEVKIFGIGGLVERAAEKNMRDGWEKAAVWMRTWMAAHPPT